MSFEDLLREKRKRDKSYREIHAGLVSIRKKLDLIEQDIEKLKPKLKPKSKPKPKRN